LVFPVLGLEPALDSLLAVAQDFRIDSIHSKWPFVGGYVRSDKHISTSIYGHFELFLLIA
jgi:hypothetical protein